ncbi:reverse transcriptase domain-containing protein [Tanacetum coccineum]
MPTWCHMFNSTLTGNARVWFDDLPKESVDSYDDLKKAFLENYLQQKKCIKDPVEIHNIRQRDGESTKEFVRRYKLECRDSVDEMMRVTTAFLRGEVAASNRKRKKSFPSWKQQEAGQKQNFKKGSFRNQQRQERKQDREVGHTTDECMHLKKQIEEMLKAGKLSHLIKELKKTADKNLAIQEKVRKLVEARIIR